MALQAVKGMKDILPSEVSKWQRLEATFREIVERYGFAEVRTPVVEPTELFVRSIGEDTDIVEKEMYTFTDRGDKSLTLRPEGTASSVRAYVQHSVQAQEPVTKWYYLGPMYRRERPAKGRYRQFYQGGVEVYGDEGPYVDAEVIDMVVSFVHALGIHKIEVLLNSLGGPGTRDKYRAALLAYYEPKRESLCSDCQRRLESNPLRLLDCKVPEDAKLAQDAPAILEYLDKADKEHFEALKQALDAQGTPYRVEPRLVRGLDYYTRTLFEVRALDVDLGAQNALLGGGRYDGLVKSLGGPETPAIGFAMGLERLLLAMPEKAAAPELAAFVVVAQKELRSQALSVAKELRAAGLRTEIDLRGASLKSQMRRADKIGARFAVIVGEAELESGELTLKDLRQQTQQSVARDQVATLISSAS